MSIRNSATDVSSTCRPRSALLGVSAKVLAVVVLPLLQYDDFEVLIEKIDDAFWARVVNSPSGGTHTVPFIPPVTEDKLELLVLKLRTAHGVRALKTDSTPDTREFGGSLFDALFHDELLDRLLQSLSHTEASGRGLRIRLRFSDADELWNIPWELLYDQKSRRFLCQFRTTPIVRYVDIARSVQPLAVQGPIRMLVMISSPSDFPPLDVEKEWQQLCMALKPLEATASLKVERLPTASLAELQHATMIGEYHVFHYIGHGGLDEQTGEGLLALTGPNGQSQLVTGDELFVMLANSPIRLAVLNSCLGGRINAVDPYAGTAASLVHQGIPAVVAMQFEISDVAAIAFSRTLYEAIAYGWPVDMAVGEARRAILATSKSEWATPVLYLRAPDGRLLEVTKPDRSPAPAPPTGLDGSVADRVVTLNWADVAAGLTPVSHWEVRRNGTPVGEVRASQARDETPGPGSYEYTVVAVSEDGQRSAESAAWTTVVPVVTPLAVPTGLTGSIVDGRIDLRWDSPVTGSAEVVNWELRRDGARIGEVTAPQANDEPGSGSYEYTVVAVGADGQRSAESTPWSAVVSVETPPPAVPTGLYGSITDGRVNLRWDPPGAGSAEVARWEVTRDGEPIIEVTSSSVQDVPPEPGAYRYTVLAVGADGQRSTQSVSYLAKIPGSRWPWLVAAAAFVVLAGLLLWWMMRPDTLSPPTGLNVTVSGTVVGLEWEQASADSAAVSEWEVRRDGELVDTTSVARFSDTAPGPGTYSYTVIAIDEDGQRSAQSDGVEAVVDEPVPPPPPAEWKALDEAGFQGSFTAAGVAEHQGELWIVGGSVSGEDRALNQVRIFDPQTEEWRDGRPLPVAVQHAALVSNGEQLFLLGGLNSSLETVDDVYRLDSSTGDWVEDSRSLPQPRFAGAAAWDGERLVFAGGNPQLLPTRETPAADIWVLESDGWVPFDGELQQPREHLAAVTDEDGRIWFVGGADISSGPDGVYDIVDEVSDDSVDVGPMIGAQLQGAAAIWTRGTGLCVFGGSTTQPNVGKNTVAVDLVDCLGDHDPGWPMLPEPRAGAAAAVVGTTVYVVGGYGDGATTLEPANMVLALQFG
jgi:CHAT domain/Kelch motif